MPIEILDIVVTASVVDDKGAGTEGKLSVDKDAIIAECVERVLEVLEEKSER